MTKPKAKPVEVEEAPRVVAWVPKHGMQDPGTRISEARIDAMIERIFNDGSRLGTPAVAATEAA